MSRWADGIYGSDSSLDFSGSIMNAIIDDMVFWFSPEQVQQSPEWLSEVLTLVEVLLIFDTHDVGTTVSLSREEVNLKRWQDTFFQVWDANWNSEKEDEPPYRSSQYRIEHQWIAIEWFKRLCDVADYWSSDNVGQGLVTFITKAKLPYFSVTHFQYRFQKAYLRIGSSFFKVLDSLIRDIVFILSEENRDHIMPYEMDEVWVSIDVMGILCEQYEVSPSLREKTIDLWLEKVITIWNERLGEDTGLYRDVLTAFDRLKAVARQYPHWNAL
jgi:hypothetical protein